MNTNEQNTERPRPEPEASPPPYLYKIRVKARLDAAQWTSWFDGLALSTAGGETVLEGKAPDLAALYGLIARLRDLAVPLVAVRVLDAEAQERLARAGRRQDLSVNLLILALYLVLIGSLSAFTVFLSRVITVPIALTLLFAVLGALTHIFSLWTNWPGWRWLAALSWFGAAITFLVAIPTSGIIPTTLGIAVMLVLAAGGLLLFIYYLQRRADKVRELLVDVESTARALRSAIRPKDSPDDPDGRNPGPKA